jgi:hypothetical protein
MFGSRDGFGAVNGLSDDIFYNQTRCFVDVFLKDLKDSGQTNFWLETCNVHALACAIEAVGGGFRHRLLTGPDGKPIMSQAGLMFVYLYSRYGQVNAPVVATGIAENEIVKNLPWVAEECAYVKATLHEFADVGSMILAMIESLKRGSANVLSYLTDYGTTHYHAQTYRAMPGVFIAYDSWPGNVHCRNGGIREEYTDNFYRERCANRLRFIEISKGD